MESPCNIISKDEDIISGQDEDTISALPNDILLQILECLDLRMAIQASVLSRRWKNLPHQLSRLLISVADFRDASRTMDQVMAAYTDATKRSLSSIGDVVGDAVKGGQTECLEFAICADVAHPSDAQLVLFGQRFMSFFSSCPGAFKSLTRLSLQNLAFEDSDVPNLLNTCNKLALLSLRDCGLGQDSVLKIDASCSELQALELVRFGCIQVELICVPKLGQVVFDTWYCENPPVYFGYVPQLRHICFASPALSWQTPFALSECFPSNRNLSILHLNFRTQMIWIEPEGPQQLSPIFSKLRDVHLYNIFVECDLNWTLFILEAAPSVQNFYLSRHPCDNKLEDSAERTNLVWETSNFKHFNLKLLVLKGFEDDNKVMDYIRLVMQRAVCLERIELRDKIPCKLCKAVSLESPSFPVDESSKYQIRKQLAHGSSSSEEIIIG